MEDSITHRFCVAPMMDWTDRHCLALHRVLSRRTRLYSEMLTAAAVLHGDRGRLLSFEVADNPVALQLGGADPAALAQAARAGEAFGYQEINLNVGCPSDRVQRGRFGACLMREPELVARCMESIIGAVAIPVSVKCRLGVDDQAPRESLYGLVDACAAVGVEVFIVHARKAWLEGLSPRENREIPPLDYDLVRDLARDRPELTIVLNGGVAGLDAAREHLAWADGVMLGRAAYHQPALLGAVDRSIFGETAADVGPIEAVERYLPYLARQLALGTPLAAMSRHMLGLFHGAAGARAWRRTLTVEGSRRGAGLEVVTAALGQVSRSAARGEAFEPA